MMISREQVGVVLLFIGTAFAIWSAFMPSGMTIGKFGLREGTEEDKRDLTVAGILALIVIGLTGVGVYMVYFRK